MSLTQRDRVKTLLQNENEDYLLSSTLQFAPFGTILVVGVTTETNMIAFID